MKLFLFFPLCILVFACGVRQSSKTDNTVKNTSAETKQSGDMSTSGGSVASQTSSAQVYAPGTLKPQTAGLALRDFSWLDTENTSVDLLRIVNSFIVKIYWKDVQPQENGELKHPNAVDDALVYVKKMNAQYPGLNLNLKIRLYCGVYTPDWVKTKAGTFTMYKGGGGNNTPQAAEVVKFWSPEFLQDYTNIQTKLAAAYDNMPEITEAVNSGTGILYAEAMIRNVSMGAGGKKNAAGFLRSDYSTQKDIDAIKGTINAMKAWKNTRVSMVFTPFYLIKAQGVDEDLSVTKNILDYFVNQFGQQAVLGNNGLRDKNSGDKSEKWEEGGSLDQVYDMLENYYKAKNNGVYFQTATIERIGDLKNAIEQGINRGAGMIELPSGSKGLTKYLSLADLKKYDGLLEAQAKK